MAVTRTMQSDWRICSQMHRFRSSCSSSSNVALALLHSSRRGSKRAAGCSRFRRSQFCLSGSSLVSSWLIKREERHGRSLFSSLLILLRRNYGNRRASTCFTSWLSPTNILVANKHFVLRTAPPVTELRDETVDVCFHIHTLFRHLISPTIYLIARSVSILQRYVAICSRVVKIASLESKPG